MHKNGYIRSALPYIFILVIGFMGYANSFHCSFQFDDLRSIVENPYIIHFDLAQLWKLIHVRIIGYLTFALNRQINGLNVPGYHLVNFGLHFVNACLLFFFTQLLFARSIELGVTGIKPNITRAASLTAALLFVAHPIQTQAVTYIVQRLASLVTLFYLFSLILFFIGRERIEVGRIRSGVFFIIGSVVSTIFAMFTKQNAFTLPLAILLVEMSFFSFTKKRVAHAFPMILAAGLLMCVIPITMFLIRDISLREISELARETDLLSRHDYFVTQINVVRTYLRLLMLPIKQHVDYVYPIYRSFFHWHTIMSALLHFILLLMAILSFKKMRIVFFGIVFFYLALSVESSFLPISDVLVEHRLYLPSVGIFIAISSLTWQMKERFQVNVSFMWFGIAVVIGVLTISTHDRNQVWKTPESLWKDTLIYEPLNWRAHYNLGKVYETTGRPDAALSEYQNSLKIREDAWPWNNIANILVRKGRVDEAIKAYQRSIALDPKFAIAHANLGVAYEKKNSLEVAIEENKKALILDPLFAPAYYNLGRILTAMGRLDDAEASLRKALDADADHLFARYRLAIILYKTGRSNEANEQLQEILLRDPTNERAQRALNIIKRRGTLGP